MNRRWPFLIPMLVLLAACEGLGGAAPTPTPVAPATLQATTPPPAGATILAEGSLVAVNPILTLAFETGGRVQQLHAEAGDQVAAGAVIATLDDDDLQEAVTAAALGVDQAENSLAQARLSLDNLLAWAPDEAAVAAAEANLAAARAALAQAQTADAAAGNSLTSARVSLDQAQRSLADAQEAYDTAYDPGREWELGVRFRREALENEREAATRNLALAEENLQVARAQYSLAVAGLEDDTAVSAAASLASAEQTLAQATTGPEASEIAAARLNVTQAELALQESRLSRQQAEAALSQAQLVAPWAGTLLTVEVAVGATVGAGAPVATLLDTNRLQFHTSNLSERDLAQIRPGQAATVVLKSFPTETLPGRVVGVAPQASGTVGDAAVFPVFITLDDTALDLRPGMTGRVEIAAGE